MTGVFILNKKRFIAGVSTLTLAFGMLNSIPANAEETDKEQFIQESTIETKQELMDTLKEVNESSEVAKLDHDDKVEIAESIFENATEKAKEGYEEKIMEELQEGSEGLDQEKLQETGYTSNKITLSDGSDVKFEASDVSEDDNYVLQGQSLSPYRKETKGYGSRRYTATVTFTSFGAKAGKISLANHYSVGKYGLKMRYTSKSPTESYLSVFDINSASTEVTKSTASKAGQAIKGYGDYSVKGGAGLFSGTKYFEIRSTIKLVSLNKTKKTAYVDQRYNFLD